MITYNFADIEFLAVDKFTTPVGLVKICKENKLTE